MSRRKLKSKRQSRGRDAEAPSARPVQDWSPRPAGAEGGERPSIAEDKRSLDRISQRELGKVEIALRPAGRDWIPVRLWDFSSIGFGVLLEPVATGRDPILGRKEAKEPIPGRPAFRADEDVDVRIRIGSEDRHETRCRVMNLSDWRGRLKIGLRRLDVSDPADVEEDRRAARRLPLFPLSLKARIRHPFIYGQWSSLAVADVNRHLGFSFQSSDPSILLFAGMELRIHFELASFRSMPITCRVTWVHATREDGIRFGTECVSMDWRLQGGICDYLLFARNWTPSMLRASGFRSQRVRDHLRFRTVRTMEDYAEVLRLRRDAYVAAGKRPGSTTPEEMATPLDGISRILMARHHGQLVGSLTFTFPVTEDTLLDSQAGFPDRKYPVPIPPKANLIEVSRLCVHQEYRGTDLLQGMFESGLKHFLMSDRHWLITSATADLVPTYRAIGFVLLKASYRHHLLNNKEHHLLIAHRSAFLWGFGIGLLTWNSVFGDLVGHLLEQKLIAAPGWMRFVIRAKLLFRPLARALSDARSRLAFHKHLEAMKRNAARGRGGANGAPAGIRPPAAAAHEAAP